MKACALFVPAGIKWELGTGRESTSKAELDLRAYVSDLIGQIIFMIHKVLAATLKVSSYPSEE